MHYWLVKSEPSEFSIDDLAHKNVEPWTGIRNYQARNHMRDNMKVGDKVLFYHSSTDAIGIVGLATVSSKPYPDPTQFNQSSDYFDPKSTPENPRWQMIDLQYAGTFKEILTLQQIKTDLELADMLVARPGQRLSVQPVTESHYHHVLSLRQLSS